MPQITDIKPQKRKKRFNIYIDDKFAFGLDADNFLKAGLKVGQELTEEQVDNLVFKNEFQKLLDKTLRLIGDRPRSEKEILDYLKKKIWKLEIGNWKFRENQEQVKNRIIGEVIKSLKKQKLIDDEAFAVWWIEQRTTFKPMGRRLLEMELRQKGIAKDLITKLLHGYVATERDQALKIAKKKLERLKGLSYKESREKLGAFLARRGFSWEVIKEVVDEFLKKE